MIEITTDNLSEQIASGVTLIDLWAPWCGPCRMLGPIIEEISAEYEDNDQVTIAKSNIDEQTEIAEKYGVTAIPTMVFLKDGEFVKSVAGVQPKATITEAINTLLEL